MPHITKCNPQTWTLTRESNFWITNITTGNESGYLIHDNCPYDYCYPGRSNVEINLARPGGAGAQCEFNRSGKLCGMCKPGLSLSMSSSRCLSCSKYWPAMFVGVVLVALLLGVALVAILLILQLTVATGTLNGLVFYANIVYANSNIYFPYGQPRFVTTFIAWLNLDLGIDMCFFEGMNAYWKTWLQLAFPAYIMLLVAAVMLASRWSPKFSRCIGKRNPVATLATLVLLSYVKFLHVIITALSFTVLNYPDGSHELVWLPDASVRYFFGKHSALFIAAVFILIACFAYTVLILSWQWFLFLMNMKHFKWLLNQKFKLFIEPYHTPYIPRHRYWTGLLLLTRIVVHLTSAVNVSGDPYMNLLITGIATSFLLFLKGSFGNIYKNWLLGSLEVACFLNIVLFSFVTFFILRKGGDQIAAAYVSGSTTLALTLAVLAYHIFSHVLSKTKLWRALRTSLSQRNLNTTTEGSSTVAEMSST